jgi:colanic acid biosynthesis protein WcaH
MISIDKFSHVVENTPLISIDFILEHSGKYILGKRINAPAKGYYFTPGGRIFKNESISDAISRISTKELGLTLSNQDIKFHGVYEHFYQDSFMSSTITTHYVVLAYHVLLSKQPVLPTSEHSDYRYFRLNYLMTHPEVHIYVKDYFKENI